MAVSPVSHLHTALCCPLVVIRSTWCWSQLWKCGNLDVFQIKMGEHVWFLLLMLFVWTIQYSSLGLFWPPLFGDMLHTLVWSILRQDHEPSHTSELWRSYMRTKEDCPIVQYCREISTTVTWLQQLWTLMGGHEVWESKAACDITRSFVETE